MESLGLGIYYRKSPRSIQKHWDAGRVVQCVHMKMYNINFVITATVNHIWSRYSKLSRLTFHRVTKPSRRDQDRTTELAQCCVGHSCASRQLSFFSALP